METENKKMGLFYSKIVNGGNILSETKVSILYIGRDSDAAVNILHGKSKRFRCITLKESIDHGFIENNKNSYDFIVSMGVLEFSDKPVKTLKNWRKLLSGSGKLFLGMNNRMGIRFFCGEEDPYTGNRFDSIENYLRLSDEDRKNMPGKCYGRYDIEQMLKQSGYGNFKRYSVFPCLEEPQLIYADGVYPNENLAIRYFPKYRKQSGIFIEEEFMMDDLIKNGLFHLMANAFIYECGDEPFLNIQHVTLSVGREREDAFATIITTNGIVNKIALYEEGIGKIKVIDENHKQLIENGIHAVPVQIKDDICMTPFIDGINCDEYMRELLYTNTEKFLQEMDRFKEIIYKSSKWIMKDENIGPILEKGYLDLVPLNCIYNNGQFVFFDQEFVETMYPANAILFRAISIIYWGHIYDQNIYPYEELLRRYGLGEKREHWERLGSKFTQKLQKKGEQSFSGQYYFRDNVVVRENRQAIAYGNETFLSMFEDIFGDIYHKKIYVFGAGRWAKFFIDMYGNDLDIVCLLDNDSTLWGYERYGCKIQSPLLLAHMDPDDYKVFICVKEYKYIVEQIKILGTKNIAVFNKNKVYPGRQCAYVPRSLTKEGKLKKYHIGYVAGVFDLFHIGHLNMFRRAKEQCDYLVVGVVSDEQVKKNKHKEPFIPFEERLEIVRNCCYVDEAIEIPIDYSGTVEAYQKYHFDVQFSGSDYENDTWWLEQKEYLESQGAELVFFPYTESTSSSMVQKAILTALVTKSNVLT